MAEHVPVNAMPPQVLAALVRLVVNFRLLTVLVSTIYVAATHSEPLLSWVLVGLSSLHLLPMLRWERVAPTLLRHPTFLGVDLIATIAILLFTGIDGPLLSYTFGTAFIAGLLYSWTGAAVFSILLTGAYGALLTGQPPWVALSFQTLVGTPMLYVLLAVGAAAVRDLLLRHAQMEIALRSAREQAAHGEERARLARELHDTLGKTLHGIVLLSTALPGWVRRDPERATREARALAAAASSAAAQARDLMVSLRAVRLDQPLDHVIRRTVDAWLDECEAPPQLDVELEPALDLTSDQRVELLSVLREALRNVQRHARARHVHVQLMREAGAVVLSVRDDGRGLPDPPEPDRLAAQGHFGLLGMRERVERLGGTLVIAANDPSGVIITARVPVEPAPPALITGRRFARTHGGAS